MSDESPANWQLFPGDGDPVGVEKWPEPPKWRVSSRKPDGNVRGRTYQPGPEEIDAVNAAIHLRRPLLVTGKPGVGKSSLAYAIAHRLQLGSVLVWPISTKSAVRDGLYQYDAIGRLQGLQGGPEESKKIGDYLTLGPLGTALYPDNKRPRVVLIDEIDKSDVDLPNDLLNVLEEGEFEIPELRRLKKTMPIVTVLDADGNEREIHEGIVRCNRERDPVVVMTSNGDRDFPAPFLRRCIRLKVQEPGPEQLREIAKAHGLPHGSEIDALLKDFIDSRKGDLATDQLLNAIFLLAGDSQVPKDRQEKLRALLLQRLTAAQ